MTTIACFRKGQLVGNRDELSPYGARIVSTRDGLAVTEGPSVREAEWLAGYDVVAVADAARALEIAARLVEARYATVEVRRLA